MVKGSSVVRESGVVRVKICGMTNLPDVLHAVEAGADALGFIFAAGSKRQVTPEQARDLSLAAGPTVARVGVFRHQPPAEVLRTADAARLSAVQLHGDPSDEEVRALAQFYPVLWVRPPQRLGQTPPHVTEMVDAPEPGSGVPFDWATLAPAALHGRWLAGGLGPDNVAQAITLLRPAGVDAVSKLEAAPGVKNPQAVSAFIQTAKKLSTG